MDYPRVQIRFSSSQTVTLRSEFDQGLHDVVLTTEKTPGRGGKVISTQFVQHSQGKVRYVYKFRILSPDGTVRVVHVNAQNANIINVKGKP